MTEDEARRVVLLRAYERPPTPPWTAADAEAAAEDAARALGEAAAADPGRFAAARAEAGLHRLLPRVPAAEQALALSAGHRALGPALAALAFGLGLATQALGPDGRLNLLAPPLLGLLAWNLLVYLAIAVHALRHRGGGGGGGSGSGTVQRAIARLLTARPPRRATAPLLRFARDWSALAAPLVSARAAAWLHAAAAALVAGAVASMYLRGLAFEYRAGWASTFLDAGAVHGLLTVVLGPASALAGLPLPSVEGFEALRLPASAGENAARWIHLHALTALLAVGLPRLALAAAAARRVHRLANDFPLPLDDAASRRWLQRRRGTPVTLTVQPYAYTPGADAARGLDRLLAHAFGPGSRAALCPAVAEGDEPALDRAAPCLLFTLAATPERETHGAAAAALPAATLLIDESTFRRRFDAARLAQRREAWRRMLDGLGRTPVFVDLGADAPDDEAAAALPLPAR